MKSRVNQLFSKERYRDLYECISIIRNMVYFILSRQLTYEPRKGNTEIVLSEEKDFDSFINHSSHTLKEFLNHRNFLNYAAHYYEKYPHIVPLKYKNSKYEKSEPILFEIFPTLAYLDNASEYQVEEYFMKQIFVPLNKKSKL